jgi:hypothetical protein
VRVRNEIQSDPKFSTWTQILQITGIGDHTVAKIYRHCVPLNNPELPVTVQALLDQAESQEALPVPAYPIHETPDSKRESTRLPISPASGTTTSTPLVGEEMTPIKGHHVLHIDYLGLARTMKINPFPKFAEAVKKLPVYVGTGEEEEVASDSATDPKSSDQFKVPENLTLVCKDLKPPGYLWFDTGCRRCVSGHEEHKRMTEELARIGLKPVKVMKQEQFIFGDAKTATSDCAFAYPSFQNSRFAGLMDIARVPVPCPGLFSLKMAKRWRCITDHHAQKIIVQKYDRVWPFQNGTPVINVLDFEEDKLDLTDIPPEFFIE